MTEFIFFIIGTMLGGLCGVTFMCLFQINNINKYHSHREEYDNEKKKHSEDNQI